MKKIPILLSLLVTLSQTLDQRKEGYLRTGEKTGSRLQDYLKGDFKNKYLGKKKDKDDFDKAIARGKAKALQTARVSEERLIDNSDVLGGYVGTQNSPDKPILRWGYHGDPVLREVRRMNSGSDTLNSNSQSSSREFMDWKKQWEIMWMKKKMEVANYTDTGGDRANMIAARPWGVSCGDPAQLDMPRGSCVLTTECNAEHRIYRGDHFCGRTQFVCCSLVFQSYDVYQGFDVSLARSSTETDTAEREEIAKKKSPKERRKRAARKKRRRKRMREERKHKIRKIIRKIIKEVRKVLNRAYRNGTKIRKRKTKTMKKFIKFLKKQYKMDRNSAKDIHENMMFDIDQDFMNRLTQIKDFNSDFMSNDTFRSIIVNKTMSFRAARILSDSYPELRGFMPNDLRRSSGDSSLRRAGISRRGGVASRRRGDAMPRSRHSALLHHRRRKYLDYDVEYGLLYD